MTKKELIEEFSLLEDFESKAAATRAIELLINIIRTKVASGESVDISGLGKFYPATQAASSGVTPGTGVPWTSPAKTVPKFKAAEGFKKAVL